MFLKFSIAKKLAFSFGGVLALLTVVAVWAVIGVGGIVADAEEVIGGNKLRGEMVQREVDHLNWVNGLNDYIENPEIVTLQVTTDHKKCGLGTFLYGEGRVHAEKMVPELVGPYSELEKVHVELHASAKEISEYYKPADTKLYGFLSEKEADHLAWVNKVYELFHLKKQSLNVTTDNTQCSLGKFIHGAEGRVLSKNTLFATSFKQLKKHHAALHNSAIAIKKVWNNKNGVSIARAQSIFKTTTIPALKKCRASIDELKQQAALDTKGLDKANALFLEKSKPALSKSQELLQNINATILRNVMTDEEMILEATTTRFVVIVFSVIAAILAVLMAVMMTRSIVGPINRIIQGLRQGAEQVSAAAGQVSGSSQVLAEGASEQASSVEEISSTLEEMSSMTKQNAQNAREAHTISKETGNATDTGQSAMEKMAAAVKEIKSSSDETAKIIKNINEIAFQTNLLALNAAVEAARAGDAGKGFAVVAEEVRNLAKRSADAANDTATLIEQSQKSADNGVLATEEVGTLLGSISGSVAKVNQLVAEVSAASDEQSQGIGQVNNAVGSMDEVIQSNAATAEESASASEELSAQSAVLNDMVSELVQIVNGAQSTTRRSRNIHVSKTIPRIPYHASPNCVQVKSPIKHKYTNNSNRKAEDIIPLEDEALAEF